nr:helix-turn-helix transcriptional regulator [Acidimicrobiia bacterium]
MSPDGQLPPALVVDLAARDGFDFHQHPAHQLTLATRGVLVMAVEEAAWVLPQSRALWIPSGISHAVEASVDTTMVGLYIDPERCPLTFEAPTVVDAGGLLRALVVHLSDRRLPEPDRARAEAVLWDLMDPLPVAALPLPIPTDERARRLTDALLADVTDPRSLAEWGRAVGASARTLARLFVAETGMG